MNFFFAFAMSCHLLTDLRWLSVGNFDPDAASDTKRLSSEPSMGRQLFFTLHNTKNDILYVSEVAIAYTGIDFGVVSFPNLGKRIYKAKVNVWMKDHQTSQWVLFYKLKLDTRNLVAIGKMAERDDQSFFLPNTILWRFDDGYYCLHSDIHDDSLLDKTRSSSWSRPRGLKVSYSLDDIRQLTSLHIGIKEFADSKLKLAIQIDQVSDKLQNNHDSDIQEKIRYLRFDLHSLHKYINKQNSANDALHSEVYTKKLHIGRSRQIIEDDFPQFKDICLERLEIAEAQIVPLQESLNSSIYPGLIYILQEIGTVLRDAYPVELPAGTGRFSICGIEFPSNIRELLDFCYYGSRDTSVIHPSTETETSSGTETLSVDSINAGLSYIVQMMMSLADIMNVTLKYKMKHGASGCYLVDTLSPQQLAPIDTKHVADIQGTIKISFPLFYNAEQNQKFTSYENPSRNFTLKNAPFEQGLNLLNKNLIMLISHITDLYSQYYHDNVANHLISNNIPVDCLDNFLWNLQYLLLFITAPTGKPP